VAGTDAVKTVGVPTLTWDYLESGEQDDVQSGVLISNDKAPSAGCWARLDVTLAVRGGGAAGVAPESDAFLRACGLSKTVSAGVSVLYSTLDTALETMTYYAYLANKLCKVVGVAGSFKLSATAPGRGLLSFSMTGKVLADPTEVSLPVLSLSSVDPSYLHTAASSIGSWLSSDATDPMVMRSIEIVDNAEIVPRPGAGATDGLIGFLLTDRKMRQAMTIEVPSLAKFDPFALQRLAGSAQPVTLSQVGNAVGKRVKIQTGRWSVKSPKIGADAGISTYQLDGALGAGAPTSGRELNLLWD
jgi:hypothetical protein